MHSAFVVVNDPFLVPPRQMAIPSDTGMELKPPRSLKGVALDHLRKLVAAPTAAPTAALVNEVAHLYEAVLLVDDVFA